jgi:hypothetical protein
MLANVLRDAIGSLLADLGKEGARGRTIIRLGYGLEMVCKLLSAHAVRVFEKPQSISTICGNVKYPNALPGRGLLSPVLPDLIRKRDFTARKEKQTPDVGLSRRSVAMGSGFSRAVREHKGDLAGLARVHLGQFIKAE